MGSLAVPGPKTGAKGAPRPRRAERPPAFSDWFPSFLRDELRPYPGRYLLASRYVLAATLTMLAIVTFRLPGAAVGGFYSLLLPRDSPGSTAKSAVALLGAFGAALAIVVTGTMLFVDYPLTHFLWVVGSFFVGFLALAMMSNYAAASAFTILIVLAVPAWDAPLPTAAIVAANLWVCGSVAIAVTATVLVESMFALFDTGDQLQLGLKQRITAVRAYLQHSAEGVEDPGSRDQVQQLALVGVSRLRRVALSSNAGAGEIARRSTLVSLVGRVVDLAASFREDARFTEQARLRLKELSRQLQAIEGQLTTRTEEPSKAVAQPDSEPSPVLGELERTTDLLRLSLSQRFGQSTAADLAEPPAPPFLVPDAFSNPEHLRFASRGCLALVICYIILNAVAWPGLSTSLFTVVVTALSSIGSSRQKQLLRFSGALVGGVVLGIGSQVILLPMLDGIGGFTAMFVAVTCIAAWFITASPRLSYFGTQMALAFFLIHLRGPFAQTNLAIARDNVMGILLGLVVMWVVFESLGSKPAVVVMRELFARNLTLMAQLATPWPDNRRADLGKIRALRDTISQNFSAVNSQADGVLFEVGRSRGKSLGLRNTLLGWQPRLRALFLVQIALLQYRAPISPAELPPGILQAQTRFDLQVKAALEDMAASFRGKKPRDQRLQVQDAYDGLQRAVHEAYEGSPTPRARAVLSLSSYLVEGTTQLGQELRRFGTKGA